MVVELVLTGVVLGVHALVAAVMTRYFRIRLSTDWGAVVYTLLFVPVVLFLLTQVFTGVLGIGPNLGSAVTVLAVMVGLPLAVGVAVDVLYMRPPEEYDLPEPQR
jgi:heme/copper-type cytochrome/quinol oxidase subunit 1